MLSYKISHGRSYFIICRLSFTFSYNRLVVWKQKSNFYQNLVWSLIIEYFWDSVTIRLVCDCFAFQLFFYSSQPFLLFTVLCPGSYQACPLKAPKTYTSLGQLLFPCILLCRLDYVINYIGLICLLLIYDWWQLLVEISPLATQLDSLHHAEQDNFVWMKTKGCSIHFTYTCTLLHRLLTTTLESGFPSVR